MTTDTDARTLGALSVLLGVDSADVLRQATTGDAAARVRLLAAVQRQVNGPDGLALYVGGMRREGASWTEVGAALGVSRQAAQQRYGTAGREDREHAAHLDALREAMRDGVRGLSEEERDRLSGPLSRARASRGPRSGEPDAGDAQPGQPEAGL
ncbi:MAG: hypothetical protein M3P95_08310 [Actinomycetota bacterium]|nr:hypothetical protein [Actinomycetota bacterium]